MMGETWGKQGFPKDRTSYGKGGLPKPEFVYAQNTR